MIDREKVIKGLKCCAGDDVNLCDNCPYLGCSTDRYCFGNMAADALALLKAQEPRVLTLEDLWALKFNETVILEQKIPSLLIPAIVRDNIKHDDALEVLQVVTASTNGTANADYEYYGQTWRCWTGRPTEEQREVTPWQN